MPTLHLISQCPQVSPFLERAHKAAVSLPTLDFRYPPQGEIFINPEDEIDVFSPSRHIYSRYTQVNSTRVEKVLGDLHVRISGASYRLSSPECIRLEWVRFGVFFRACCNLRGKYLPPSGGRRSEPDTFGRHWCTSGPSVSPSVMGTMEFTKRFKSTAK